MFMVRDDISIFCFSLVSGPKNHGTVIHLEKHNTLHTDEKVRHTLSDSTAMLYLL